MKSLFFITVSITILSGISFSAVAQKKAGSKGKRASGIAASQVKFIEGIEIKRALQPVTEPVNALDSVKASVVAGRDNLIEQCLSIQFKYAQILNKNVESVTHISLFRFIEEWWEVHYRYGGTTKEGIDCSAFVCLLFSKLYATEIPRTAKEQYAACKKMQREELTEGSLVFFNTRGGVSHVGVYLGDGYFVHASTGNGVTINNLDDDYYSARFLGGGNILQPSGDAIVNANLQ